MTHTCPKCGAKRGGWYRQDDYLFLCHHCREWVNASIGGYTATQRKFDYEAYVSTVEARRLLVMTDEMPTPNSANPVEQCLENLERQMPPLANLSEADKRWLHQVGVAA